MAPPTLQVRQGQRVAVLSCSSRYSTSSLLERNLNTVASCIQNSLHTRHRLASQTFGGKRTVSQIHLGASSLRPHVDIGRPSCRCPWNLRSELLHRRIECIRDGVCVDHLVREQVFVEPLSHVGAIGVAHGPVRFSSVEVARSIRKITHHIVATTLLKPACSIADATCTT
jgi:hypothetical protein